MGKIRYKILNFNSRVKKLLFRPVVVRKNNVITLQRDILKLNKNNIISIMNYSRIFFQFIIKEKTNYLLIRNLSNVLDFIVNYLLWFYFLFFYKIIFYLNILRCDYLNNMYFLMTVELDRKIL